MKVTALTFGLGTLGAEPARAPSGETVAEIGPRNETVSFRTRPVSVDRSADRERRRSRAAEDVSAERRRRQDEVRDALDDERGRHRAGRRERRVLPRPREPEDVERVHRDDGAVAAALAGLRAVVHDRVRHEEARARGPRQARVGLGNRGRIRGEDRIELDEAAGRHGLVERRRERTGRPVVEVDMERDRVVVDGCPRSRARRSSGSPRPAGGRKATVPAVSAPVPSGCPDVKTP